MVNVTFFAIASSTGTEASNEALRTELRCNFMRITSLIITSKQSEGFTGSNKMAHKLYRASSSPSETPIYPMRIELEFMKLWVIV